MPNLAKKNIAISIPTGIGADIGVSVSYHTKDAREIRITKYLDELHGYALEENKNYPKRVLSKNK